MNLTDLRRSRGKFEVTGVSPCSAYALSWVVILRQNYLRSQFPKNLTKGCQIFRSLVGLVPTLHARSMGLGITHVTSYSRAREYLRA
jgi:hypothetical protein